MAKTVTVSAAEDDDAVTDGVATVTHTLSGGGYGSVTAPDVEVTVTENDAPGLFLSEATLTVVEGNATGSTYTVKLATEPTATVTVTVSGQANTDLNVSGLSSTSTLTFTTDDWNTPRR